MKIAYTLMLLVPMVLALMAHAYGQDAAPTATVIIISE